MLKQDVSWPFKRNFTHNWYLNDKQFIYCCKCLGQKLENNKNNSIQVWSNLRVSKLQNHCFKWTFTIVLNEWRIKLSKGPDRIHLVRNLKIEKGMSELLNNLMTADIVILVIFSTVEWSCLWQEKKKNDMVLVSYFGRVGWQSTHVTEIPPFAWCAQGQSAMRELNHMLLRQCQCYITDWSWDVWYRVMDTIMCSTQIKYRI